jgi:hypothetical protein
MSNFFKQFCANLKNPEFNIEYIDNLNDDIEFTEFLIKHNYQDLIIEFHKFYTSKTKREQMKFIKSDN